MNRISNRYNTNKSRPLFDLSVTRSPLFVAGSLDIEPQKHPLILPTTTTTTTISITKSEHPLLLILQNPYLADITDSNHPSVHPCILRSITIINIIIFWYTAVAVRTTTTTTTTTSKQTKRIKRIKQKMTIPPSTPDICDDFADTIRVVDPSIGLHNLGGKSKFGGQVVTVKCFEDNSVIKQLSIIPNEGIGKVMVVDGGGSRRCALLGDQVALDCLVKSKWEGLIIYGSIRDVDEIQALSSPLSSPPGGGLGVQALGTHPCKTLKRNEGQINIPVTFGGVTFRPGDYVVCDNNGIVVSHENILERKNHDASSSAS